MSGQAFSILLVDDDEVFRSRMARALRERGHEVRAAGSAEEALALAGAESPEYAVVDLKMPGKGGLHLLAELKALDSSTEVLMLTGYGSIPTALEAVRRGALDYLSKPLDADELLAAMNRLSEETTAAVPETATTPTLARAEWEHIQRVLADCEGNVSEAARRLGLHRKSLQRKLHKYPPAR
jgi:two-component system, response regulator RegA